MGKMHALAELIFDEELDILPSYIKEDPPQNVDQRLWYLSKSIDIMSKADYVIGIDNSIINDKFPSCDIERYITIVNDMPAYLIRDERIIYEFFSDVALL